MAEGKLDLPDDLLSSKSPGDPWAPKDDAARVNDDEKALMGFFDDSKDQVTSESNIPLSPQWLYAKPSDIKTGLSASSGDMRAPNSLPHGIAVDTVQKEGWRLDGSQEKKEWRRNAPEAETNRRWREEERETGLLGRRDRRKESDRRADSASIREITESRPLPSSDRWHDVSSRNSGHETRRDSKWSSRWGPEDKEKDSRADKKVDGEKEDAHNEKQSFISSTRAASERENDSRDKWRPRHRQEVHSGGSAVYRAAPGFGLERGRVEGSNLGFAPGRGRPNTVGSPSLSRPSSSGPIGAAPADKNDPGHGKAGLSADTFCYPRGKLLDIYRRHKLLPAFDITPDGIEEAPPITQIGLIEPLAFVAPDAEEEAVLEDMWKGKVTSSGVSHNLTIDSVGKVHDDETGVADGISTESKQCIFPASSTEEAANDSNLAECDNKLTATVDVMTSGGFTSEVRKGDDICNIRELDSSLMIISENKAGQTSIVNGDGQAESSTSFKPLKFKDVESATSFDIRTKLPDDSNLLFDPLSSPEISGNEQYVKSNGEAKVLEQVAPPEEMSLFYRDPQGEIQGPFLGVDIISWFEQGFYGTDLPVCLSDAPEGTPFQELGEVMPHLKLKVHSVSGFNTVNKPYPSDSVEGTSDTSALAPDFTTSTAVTDQQWASSEFEAPSRQPVQPRISKREDPLEPHYAILPPIDSETSRGIVNAERRNFHEFVEHDTEEVLFSGRHGSNSGNPVAKLAGNLHDPLGNPTSHHLQANELGENSMLNHNVLKDNNNNFHPFGLLWSELEGPHPKLSHSSNMSSGVGEQGPLINTAMERDAALFNRKQNSVSALADSPIVRETWPDSFRRNALAGSNILQDVVDARHLSHMEQESNRFDLAEHMLSQQLLQKQRLQQQDLLSTHPSMHLNGSVLEQLAGSALPQSLNPAHQQSMSQPMVDFEHLLKLQFQQQRQLQLQQQHDLQQQQRQQLHHHHQMQLQQQQQQQQSHVQQLLLEQFLHQQMHDPGFAHSRVDPLRSNNMLDQGLFRQHLLHELQQHSHPPLRPHDPSIEQFIQSKFGHSLHPEQHNELLELLSHAKHGQMHPLDQQLLLGIQQEQLRAQQFSTSSRLQPSLEEERHVGGVWSVDESGQFVRTAANSHQTQSAGFSPLDFYQQKQRPSSYEQPSSLERNLALHERLHRGIYEPSSLPFERPIPLHGAAPGRNLDVFNTLARVQELDIQEHHSQMHSPGQMSSFSSDIRSLHPQIPNQFHASHLDSMDGGLTERNGQPPNEWIESRMRQLHLEAERRKRESEMNLISEDVSSWASAMGNGENSKRVMMDLLHQKLVHPSNQSLELNESNTTSSYERREPSRLVSASASDHPYNLLMGQTYLTDSFAEGPQGHNLVNAGPEQLVNAVMEEQAHTVESSERLPYRSNSGAFIEDEQFFPGINETARTIYADPSMVSKPSVERVDLSEAKEGKKGKKRGSKSKVVNKPVTEAQESIVELAGGAVTDRGKLLVNAPIRNASLVSPGGSVGFYNYDTGVDSAYGEESAKDRVSSILSKGLDSTLLKSPHVSRVLSSQEALSELASTPSVKGKNQINLASSDEGRRDHSVNPATQASETTASIKKEMRFRRTSSCSDTDTSEPSFIDMLKSTKKLAPETDATAGATESLDAAQGGKSGKKKGKKGRQIDPALLGFKVTSNRIMMGEIQRPED
ncbi:uncharacterized protein LOC131239412 isoform X2 [Magnolia sinica]|uniref:uncharacterized protein LOC131239412 isoform X2 n=1 Tax=Magnolia sinica TaxID=86752 RepID=UPI00265A4058|nr:uncharacterized protein LOC131239412 isoform X2 [Magnolia sinica]